MSFWKRIRELHMEKRRSFPAFAAVEGLLLLLAVAGLFGKNQIYRFETSEAFVNQEASAGENILEFQNIALPAGTYQVRLQYETDTEGLNHCGVFDKSLLPGKLRTNGADLYAGLHQTDYELWLLQDTSTMTVYVQYAGEGQAEVSGLEIYRTNALSRVLLFLLLALLTGVNICAVYVQYDKKYGISLKQKTVTFLLGLIILFASLPLFTDALPGAGDLIYHLMRVEGIKDGIMAGQFPVRISPDWLQGYGYASPVFYGETILYLAGAFRLIGFSLLTSYRLFMLVMVAATALIAYFCFKKLFREAYVGVFCSGLYTLSVYRIFKTYIAGSWGETMGVMLLPLLVYGFYRVFAGDVREKSYKRSWIPLTIGFTLIVQSHLLTGEMAGFFTILLCLICMKKVFRRETFTVLAKTALYSVLLGAWFLIPFVDYMTTGDFVIHHVSARTIQERGLYPAHLLYSFFRAGSNVFFEENGMAASQPMGVGIGLIAALILWCFLRFNGKTKGLLREEIGLGRIAGWFGVLSMVMSLSLFPWNQIQRTGGIAATLVSSIQFPNRFLSIATLCLVTLAGLVAKAVFAEDKKFGALYLGGMAALLGVSSIFLLNSILDEVSVFRAYNSESIGTGYIAGAEYLPYGTEPSLLLWHDPAASGNITVENYVRKPLGGEADVVNPGADTENLTFSLLYYKGYRAREANTGQELAVRAGENNQVTVEIPPGFAGRVSLDFVSPWYWRLGEAVSLLTLTAMLLSSLYEKKKAGKEAGQA